MKKILLALAVAGAAVSVHADVKVSGHVNYVAGDVEDFTGQEQFFVGVASSSESRFRLVADTEANGITYGIKQEFGLGAAGSSDIDKRVNEFYLKGSFGKVALGQGSQAGDGATEKDFSGTYVTTGGSLGSTRANVAGGAARISQVDGGRVERLRYDTPKLGGNATISASLHDGEDFALAVTGGTSNIAFGLYAEDKESGDGDEVGGSIALLFGGFNAALQYGEADEIVENTKLIVGWKNSAYSIAGVYHLSDYEGDHEAEALGLSFVYRPTKGVELYAGITDVDSEVDDDDGNSFVFGGRVKF